MISCWYREAGVCHYLWISEYIQWMIGWKSFSLCGWFFSTACTNSTASVTFSICVGDTMPTTTWSTLNSVKTNRSYMYISWSVHILFNLNRSWLLKFYIFKFSQYKKTLYFKELHVHKYTDLDSIFTLLWGLLTHTWALGYLIQQRLYLTEKKIPSTERHIPLDDGASIMLCWKMKLEITYCIT